MQQQSQDFSSLSSRITAVEFHVESAEKNIEQLRSLLANYVRTPEYELKVQSIKEAVQRIEADVNGAKTQLMEINAKLATQEAESQKRDAAQRESQDKLQIRVLWWIVATIISIASAVLIGYLTHIFH